MSKGMQPDVLSGNSLASATLDQHGEFCWRTQRAREWLDIYLKECGEGARRRVQRWIAEVVSGNQGCNQQGSRICLSRPGATLHLHLVGRTESGEFLVLLEEFRLPEFARIPALASVKAPAPTRAVPAAASRPSPVRWWPSFRPAQRSAS